MGRKPLLEKKKRGISVYVERDVLKVIAKEAQAKDRSLSYVASAMLRDAVQRMKAKKANAG